MCLASVACIPPYFTSHGPVSLDINIFIKKDGHCEMIESCNIFSILQVLKIIQLQWFSGQDLKMGIEEQVRPAGRCYSNGFYIQVHLANWLLPYDSCPIELVVFAGYIIVRCAAHHRAEKADILTWYRCKCVWLGVMLAYSLSHLFLIFPRMPAAMKWLTFHPRLEIYRHFLVWIWEEIYWLTYPLVSLTHICYQKIKNTLYIFHYKIFLQRIQ